MNTTAVDTIVQVLDEKQVQDIDGGVAPGGCIPPHF